MRTLNSLLLPLWFWFWFWTHAGLHAAQTGSKCGAPQVWSTSASSLRIVGGTKAAYGSHPWLVSLQKRGSHFCAGAILTERWILTAAHCVASMSKESLGEVRVLAGEFDLRARDKEEQVFLVKSVTAHEKYRRVLPMNYDIALVELDQHIRMGTRVQPLCLPLAEESSLPQTPCLVAGWGRTKERGRLSAVLREVQLDLLEPDRCKRVLQTLKSSFLNHKAAMTVLCAGQERGGKDACQGDSGGPLVCPAGSGSGHWVAAGITSWGKGCGRSWADNSSRPPSGRGSPGIFTDVRLLLPWIKQKLREAEQQPGTTSSRLCSVSDGHLSAGEGVIRNPRLPSDRYDNNQMCVWSITAPPGHGILLEFDRFDLENDSCCQYDRLTVSARTHRTVGIFCGRALPGPVLLQNSQNATLRFSSDINGAGSGFVVRHRAVRGHSHPGCGAVVLVEEQAELRSPDHPRPYAPDCVLRWVVHAPHGHVVKLDFADFDLEGSEECVYDSLAVFGDVAGTEEIALLCGGAPPPPVLSYGSLMVLRFSSDGSVAHRGFRAALTFVAVADLHVQGGAAEGGRPPVSRVDQPQTASHVDQRVSDPVVQRLNSRVLRQRLGGDQEASQGPRLHTAGGPDDEDHSGESSGKGL
ncbi:LOW QUALITY PROTEIN: ovochymase-2 [Menidia menidia]